MGRIISGHVLLTKFVKSEQSQFPLPCNKRGLRASRVNEKSRGDSCVQLAGGVQQGASDVPIGASPPPSKL